MTYQKSGGVITVIVLALLLMSCIDVGAQEGTDETESRNWLRYPAISPDGERIAFSFRGDIWVVPQVGGEAKRLTSNQGYERSPVWSPDGKQIAFAADWHGNFDVFIVAASGGQPKRLTYHSSGMPGRLDYHLPGDIPTGFTPDGNRVLFGSRRHDAHTASHGNDSFGELYSISIEGGRPRQVMSTQGDFANFDSSGRRIVFHDYKGYEDRYRKHNIASSTRDIWIFEPGSGSYKQLSNFGGDDRNPVWAPDDEHIFFLSEQQKAIGNDDEGLPVDASMPESSVIPVERGSLNIWKLNVEQPETPVRITDYKDFPVRFLSVARNGILCYGYRGSIYTMKEGNRAEEVKISFPEFQATLTTPVVYTDSVSEYCLSPDQNYIAIVIRGEVFLIDLTSNQTHRITNTPQQESHINWTPDGKSLVYSSERNAKWSLFRADLQFLSDSVTAEEHEIGPEAFQAYGPVCSPDGKLIAFAKDDHEIAILDRRSNEVKTLVSSKIRYASEIHSPDYRWSPDSRWLTFTYVPYPTGVTEVGIANVLSGEVTNLSESGYADRNSTFAAHSNSILYLSNRSGMRSHGGWGSQLDLFAVCLDQSAQDNWPKSSSEPGEVITTKLDKTDLAIHRHRLTSFSSQLGVFDLSADGKFLLFSAKTTDRWGLFLKSMENGETREVMKLEGRADVRFGKNSKHGFMLQNGKLSQLDLSDATNDGRAVSKPIEFAAELNFDAAGERRYIFEHARNQIETRFYDLNHHGVDCQALEENYRPFLDSINNNYDLADLLSEFLGEFNVSHTGCRFRPKTDEGLSAGLGLLFDQSHRGDGLKVAEVIRRGPLHRADCKIVPGTFVTHINGTKLTEKVNHWSLLNLKKKTQFTLRLRDPNSNREWTEAVDAIDVNSESYLLYLRWEDQGREAVKRLSRGRIGYLHIPWMSDSDFRYVYSEALGRFAKAEALIVDTRFNGGGWLADDLVTLLSGVRYSDFATRNRQPGDLGSQPMMKWKNPVVVLVNECNYSEGHCFPWAFKENKIGKLVGAPVPGTSTMVWQESQLNPEIVMSFPIAGSIDLRGKFLENQQLEPDVLVVSSPEAIVAGEDPQLEAAVDELLKEIDNE